MSAKRRTLTAVLAIAMGALMITDARAMEWDEIQTFKRQCLESAARNAMANQKTDRAADVPLNVLESAVAEGGAVVAGPGQKGSADGGQMRSCDIDVNVEESERRHTGSPRSSWSGPLPPRRQRCLTLTSM